MTRSRTRTIVLPLAIFVAGIIIFQALKLLRPEPPKRHAAPPTPLVQVYEVPSGSPHVEVKGFGTVHAKHRITIVPQVSGTVVAKSPSFEAGEYFRRGDLLLSVDETDYRLARERASVEVATAEYRLATAEEEALVARREWALISDDLADDPAETDISPTPLVLHEPQLTLARAELDAARAALERATADLERCRLAAPFDGRVIDSQVDEGQYIRAGSSIGTIHSTDAAEVIVPLADRDLAWVEIPATPRSGDPGEPPARSNGSPATIRAEFAGGRYEWEGRVARVSGAVDDRSRQLSVVVEIPQPFVPRDGRPALVEGLFVDVVIRGPRLSGAGLLPRSALRNGDLVWIVTPEEELEIRPVEVARADADEAIIRSGLSPGELVVVSSLPYATSGMKVQVDRGAIDGHQAEEGGAP